MATLTRWDPFRDMMALQNQMDRFLGEAFRSVGNWSPTGNTWGLALDVRETDEAFIVKASVPGVTPDDLDINLVQNVLTIQGEIREEEGEGQIYLQERHFGKFYRSIQLPTAVESDQVEASYENGVLTLYLPKAEEAKPKRIAVHSNGHKTIEGQVA